MFGHKWETAEGTVVSAEADNSSGRPRALAYTVEVHKPVGGQMTGRVEALSFMYDVLPPGSKVKLEVNHKTGEMRLDPHHPVIRAAHTPASSGAAAGPGAGQDLGQFMAALGDAASQGRVHFTSGTTEIHVGGAEATVVGGEQTAELMSALLAGGSARAEAVAKIKQLRADAAARSEQGGHAHGPGPTDQRMPEGFSSGHQPSTFDVVSTTPNVPVAPPAPAPAEPVTFSAPPVFTPPASPAAPHGDAFSAGPDAFGSSTGTFAEPSDAFAPPAEEEF